MSIKRIDLLLPLLVVVIAGGAVALVVGLTGTAAEPGPPTPFEQEDPPAPQTGLFPTDKITVPLKDFPPMHSPFDLSAERSQQKSVEQMTPEELESYNKRQALRNRNPFGTKNKPLRKVGEEEDGAGISPEAVK